MLGRGLLLLIALIPLSGCTRTHSVPTRISSAPLLTATRSDLVERINAEAEKVQTLKATVTATASVGGPSRGKITQYPEIHGYILIRKPSSLRMIGLMPVLHSRVFDVASDENSLKVWMPTKNQFIVGHNHTTTPSPFPLAHLRPELVFDALLLQAVDLQGESAILEQGTRTLLDDAGQQRVKQPDYILEIIKQGSNGWYLSRKITFDRTDLRPRRQTIYDDNGSVVTDARYYEYSEFNGCVLPTRIQIWHPQEEYSIKLKIVKLTINEPVSDDQFVLEPPPGALLAFR